MQGRKNLIIVIVILWAAVGLANPINGGVKLDIQYDKKKLEAGELQVFTHQIASGEQGETKRVVGVLLIDAPPEKVWETLEHWDAMGEYIPSLEYYRTVQVLKPVADDTPGESLIEGKLKAAFISIRYTLHVTFDKANLRQDWKLISKEEMKRLRKENSGLKESSATLKDIRGFEYIEPYGDGAKTIYYYAPVVEVSMPVPAWVERQLSKSSLNEYMEGVKKKVEASR